MFNIWKGRVFRNTRNSRVSVVATNNIINFSLRPLHFFQGFCEWEKHDFFLMPAKVVDMLLIYYQNFTNRFLQGN